MEKSKRSQENDRGIKMKKFDALISDRFLFKAKTLKGNWVIGRLSESLGYENQPKELGYYISNTCGSPWAYLVIPSTITYIDKCDGLFFID